MEKAIDLVPKNKIVITPKKFLSLSAKERRNIRSAKFIPPSIGDKNFGSFVIKLKRPQYSTI